MPPHRYPGPSRSAEGVRVHPAPGSLGVGSTHPLAPDLDAALHEELALDLLQLGLDLAGLLDPTPISDTAGAVVALGRGRWLDAILSGAGVIPFVGDLAKAGKLPRYARSLERVIELAERSPRFADKIAPGIQKLRHTLDLFPVGANQHLDRLRELCDRFLSRRSMVRTAVELPDVSRQFRFRAWEDGERLHKEGWGRLGVPGKVQKHRSTAAQRDVSAGTGDDAGHLIGNRFGAPGTAENLSQQNWIANRGGTFKDMENGWQKKLEQGYGIEVRVRDVTRRGEDRPFLRHVEWTEVAPDGSVTRHVLDFANTHTPKSRTAQGIPPTVATPQKDNVIPVDFVNKKKLP